ncbi:predicted aminopeptidase [Longilinea arvoryzae]|uniref:Predicted aminopeptidase n=1 Tax=Longilinea arvoryzae TaxID=360412 RepID=A0A0S7BFV6_9CHLR|nr:M28 family peptidase [Longilinea arvoryzae]GAP13366.1 predicted aminopeptidase [Longilinea arvoryzae]
MSDSLNTAVARHLKVLSEQIGARPASTPANRAAAEYIAAEMRRIGLEVELQPLACPNWRCLSETLTLDGEALAVLANPFSPACDVRAPFTAVCTLAELEHADLSGRIALIYGELTRQPLAAKSWFLSTPDDLRVVNLLEQKAPLAVLAVQALPGSTNRLVEDWEFTLPSATLPAESGLALLTHPESTLHLRLETEQQPGETRNVVGRRAGSRPETAVACAHFDTKYDTPGASDNAAGVAALLALAERLQTERLDCGLEYVAFTNEEYLPIGEDAYIPAAGEGHFERLLLAINFDGLGHRLDALTLASFTCSPEFQTRLEQLSSIHPGVQWIEPWPESNHSSFAMRGVPALAFSGQAVRTWAHQRCDALRWVNPSTVLEAAELSAGILRDVQSQPLAWLRPVESNA